MHIRNDRPHPISVIDPTQGCGQPARYARFEGFVAGREVSGRNPCAGDWDPLGEILPCAAYDGRAAESLACKLCSTSHPPVRIEPGATLIHDTELLLVTEVELGRECNALGTEPTVCLTPLAPALGEYEVTVYANSVPICEHDDTSCDCEPGDDGLCDVDRSPISPVDLSVTAAWNGACRNVLIVFEP